MSSKEESIAKLSTKQIVSWFIASYHTSGGFTNERITNSIALLKRVPASRHVVLQRFTQLFEEASRSFFSHRSMEYGGPGHTANHDMLESIGTLSETLYEFLNKNGRAWGPILCEWSVESLVHLSNTFKMGGSMSGSSISGGTKLDETVANWMKIYPARVLINLYRHCLRLLINKGDVSCVDSLLSAAASYSPNFDWVVADVGNSFPQEITDRVIKSGFKDFVKQQWGDSAMDEDQSKLKSVVLILEHLSNRHSERVQKSIVDLYQSSSSEDNMQAKATLYIMQLLSDSPILIRVTTRKFIDILNSTSLNNLYRDFRKLPDYNNKVIAVSSLAVHLICQSSYGSFSLIRFLLIVSSDQSFEKPLREVFGTITTMLLKDLLRIALRKRANGEKQENGVVSELKKHCIDLCDMFLETEDSKKKDWLVTLLKIVSIKGYGCVVFYELLCGVTDLEDLLPIFTLYTFTNAVIPGMIDQVLEYSFAVISSEGIKMTNLNNFIKNIWRLLLHKVDAPGSYELQNRLQKSLWNHISDLKSVLSSVKTDQVASFLSMDILSKMLSSPDVAILETCQFSLTTALVAHFFKLLHSGGVNNDPSMVSCRNALVELSQAPAIFSIVCQCVLESSVMQTNAILFGRRTEEIEEDEDGAPMVNHLFAEQRMSLLSQHRAHKNSSSVVGYVPVVVETGLIGSGPKRKKSCPLSKSAQVTNNECISLLLHRCSCKTGSGSSMEGGEIHDMPASFDEEKLIILSKMLFEAITSSTQGALLHSESKWPDPQFRKYTVERDLHIFTFFDEHPFVWSIMDLLANSPKALWKCSMLIRAMTGALLYHWDSSRENSAAASDCQLKHSVKVIKVLEKGQLLPEPLCYVGELFSLLSPYEVFLIMNDVWKYIHAHPLSDASYNSSRRGLVDGTMLQPCLLSIHSILHANIAKMGHLYARFVPSKPQVNSAQTKLNTV